MTIHIKVRVENAYELYDDVTVVREADVPPPPAPLSNEAETTEEVSGWKYEHLFALTGVGHSDGHSWYDLEVLESSDPGLIPVGYEAQFGDY